MKRSHLPIFGAFVVLAAFIWLRDLRWVEAASDTLPILAALPVFYWLGRPWQERPGGGVRLRPVPAMLAAVLFPFGMVMDSGFILAASWTALLWSWLSAEFAERPGAFIPKLLILPLLSFPWLTTDGERIAWWFRLSGAAATEEVLGGLGVAITREGTNLWSNDLAISVEPACSGVNGLQSMLIAGGAVLYVLLRHSTLFWWNLPLLAAAAWLAHFFRIVIAALCGVALEPATAASWVGPVHSLAGWIGLIAVFGLCYACFAGQAAALVRWKGVLARFGRPHLPWPNLIVLAYAAYCARGLVDSWRWTPYDRLAWLAFLVWLIPILLPATPAGGSRAPRHGLLFLACLLLLAGSAADINAIHHLGLAAVLAGFHRRPGWLPWLAGAIAWMPLAGWFGSRLGLEPAVFSACRLVLAAVAAIAGMGWSWRFGRAAPATVVLSRRVRHAD